jgi:hypothetical protein
MKTGSRSSPGAYGFRISGADGARELLVDAPPDWPELALERRLVDVAPPAQDTVGPDFARLPLQHGWVELSRKEHRATFALRTAVPDGDLVHPYLAPAAAVAARWAGRESFHAGAVLMNGGAWGVLGDKETGKSSTLAWLALHGHDILMDDLLVLDGDDALAGPRCIDLREEPAARLRAGEPLGFVGLRERWRLRLDPVPPRVPLRGWVTLAWGDRVEVEAVRSADRLLALLPLRSVRLVPPAPDALVRLASLPVLQLRRPQVWESLPDAAEALLAAVAGEPGGL